MPKQAPLVPETAWEKAECAEMEDVIQLYGKVYHLWQVDKGHSVPLGEPQLMTSITADGQMDFEQVVGERDRRFATSFERKREIRGYIKEPDIHPGEWRSVSRQTFRIADIAAESRCGRNLEELEVSLLVDRCRL